MTPSKNSMIMLNLCVVTLMPFLDFVTDASICDLPSLSGPCEAYSEQFYYNSTSKRCDKLIYGGCGGNFNRFPTLLDCKRECDSSKASCFLPVVSGPCEAHIPSYFFNSTSARCEEFIYGGCEGNNNSFETIGECRNMCPDICTLPSETGMCKAHLPKFYYNYGKKRCEEFVYGGCGGNPNRFSTIGDCLATCSGSQSGVSLLVTCAALIPVFFYYMTAWL